MNHLKSLLFSIASLFAISAHAATIHIPDSFLGYALNKNINLSTDSIKCALINISSYDRVTDTAFADVTEVTGTGYTAGGQAPTSVVVTTDTTNHKTTIVYTPAVWSGSTTISATGLACYDITYSNKLLVIDDFGGTVSSTAGTYTVNPITVEFTHF